MKLRVQSEEQRFYYSNMKASHGSFKGMVIVFTSPEQL